MKNIIIGISFVLLILISFIITSNIKQDLNVQCIEDKTKLTEKINYLMDKLYPQCTEWHEPFKCDGPYKNISSMKYLV